MTMRDVNHIGDAEKAALVKRWSNDRNRETILYGADAAGGGSVFEFPTENITHNRRPASFPSYWKWLWGFDFSHGGSSDQAHPFAAVLACWNPDPSSDQIFITHAIRMKGAVSAQHVARIKEHVMWDAPVCWPHDGNRGQDDGGTLAGIYKKHGLNMQPTHTTFPLPAGGYSLEVAGISAMRERFSRGGLFFPAWESEAFRRVSRLPL